jgi:hypothetical protein
MCPWRSVGTCALCGKETELQASHIVPRFVGKWMKDTSATGFLSKSEDLSERVQDLPTEQLLCTGCEQIFSGFESYFAKNIFYPFHEKKVRVFDYDERLGMFALSLSWRTLKASYSAFKVEVPKLAKQVDLAEDDWRNILLSKRSEMRPYETHLIFLDYIKRGENLPPNFQWYSLRTTDLCLVEYGGRIFAYTKLPWMVFVTSIHPHRLEGWNKTLIERRGKISPPQEIVDGIFGRLLIDRAELALDHKLPKWRQEALLRSTQKNPQRWLESDSLELYIAEKDRARKEKMKNMPESVRSLFTEAIALATDEDAENKSEKQQARLASRVIADALANLSPEEAYELNWRILGAIRLAQSRKGDSLARFGGEGIQVSFLVNPHSTKAYQQEKIKEEADELDKSKSSTKRRPRAIFSLYVDDDGTSFEIGFLID